MKVESWHGWEVSVAQARDIQRRLAGQVSASGDVPVPRYIAGVDISVPRAPAEATGAVVVLSYPDLSIAEVRLVKSHLDFPYIPGLLSFREAPMLLAACRELSITPDLIMVDGQGIAHPRRLGLACHLGLLLDTPAIGCAKSRLCGAHDEPGIEAGSYAELSDSGEVIGAVLRTRSGVRPLYVSVGHKIDLKHAIQWVLACCRGYRLPEPTRLAHQAAGGNLRANEVTIA